LLSLVLCW
jgi:hypothetical protein